MNRWLESGTGVSRREHGPLGRLGNGYSDRRDNHRHRFGRHFTGDDCCRGVQPVRRRALTGREHDGSGWRICPAASAPRTRWHPAHPRVAPGGAGDSTIGGLAFIFPQNLPNCNTLIPVAARYTVALVIGLREATAIAFGLSRPTQRPCQTAARAVVLAWSLAANQMWRGSACWRRSATNDDCRAHRCPCVEPVPRGDRHLDAAMTARFTLPARSDMRQVGTWPEV